MLRPGLEERVREVEDRVTARSIVVDAVCDSIDETCESIEDGITDAIPVEALEDPSVVNHRIDLGRTARRVRRESEQNPPVGFVVRDRRR